ncbi:MAG: hypothetical protein AUG51_06830 [Acidobacteria bacterium 13_1_20CM_3_53_8]|nr:MAG: hypothetical protein AUG51_06830 [Acidobacteria bacterium 13_1_20CM_3_53_8]
MESALADGRGKDESINICRLLSQTLTAFQSFTPDYAFGFVRGYILVACCRRLVERLRQSY